MTSGDPQAWRGVPVADMREWYRNEVERTSYRAVGERAGFNTSTLNNFVRGADPHPRVRSTLAELYLRNAGTERVMESALSVLLVGLPPEYHDGGTRRIRKTVADVFMRAGVVPPRWARAEP
jgi:hypothetical protein